MINFTLWWILIKITGGSLRSRSIKVIDSENLRPTTSFFREWIFNVLNSRVDFYDLKVVDLFSGSGIVGIEFLSRGCESVSFVEKDRKVSGQIEKNLESIKIDKQVYNLYNDDSLNFIETLLRNNDFNDECNLLFLDPPYGNQNYIDNFLKIINNEMQKIAKYFIIVIESSLDYKMDERIQEVFFAGFSTIKEKISGKTRLTIYEKKIK